MQGKALNMVIVIRIFLRLTKEGETMKRFVSILVALCLFFSVAFAEGEQPESVWDSIGGWLDQAWKDASDWFSEAWPDAAKWVEGAWGDASKWVKQAWNDSSSWVTDIWGDVSTWANEAYESASDAAGAWWVETFNTITRATNEPWKWLVEESATLRAEARTVLSGFKTAVIGDSEKAVKAIFNEMLRKLELSEEDSQKVWDTVEAYAKQKGISQLSAAKLALPYLLQLTIDREESQDPVPAIAIAQYLTGIIEKLNVNSADSANELVDQLKEALDEIQK